MNNIIKTKTGQILISIIWGLGLAALFGKSCEYGSNCEVIEYRGPSTSLAGKIWNYGDDKCYKLNSKTVPC